MSLAFVNLEKRSGLLVYMDDVMACSATWEAPLRILEDMFQEVQAVGLTLKPSKINFGPREDRVKDIIDLKTPTTAKKLRSVYGTINFVRKFIPNLATAIKLLAALTRKAVAIFNTLQNHWGPEQTLSKRVVNFCSCATSPPVR